MILVLANCVIDLYGQLVNIRGLVRVYVLLQEPREGMVDRGADEVATCVWGEQRMSEFMASTSSTHRFLFSCLISLSAVTI